MRFILLFLLLLPTVLFGQNKVIDSLKTELSLAKTDSARIMINLGLGKRFLNSDAKKALAYAKTAEELSIATNFPLGRAKALNLLGSAQLIAGEYSKSMDVQYRALELGKRLKDTTVLISSYLNLGNVYLKLKDTSRGERNYLLAAKLAQKAGDTIRLSNAYNNLGNVQEERGNIVEALSYYRQAERLQAGLGEKKTWAVSLLNIGNSYLLLGQPEKGLPYLFQSLRINQEIGNDMIKLVCLGKIAEAYRLTGRAKEGLRYAQEGYETAVKVDSKKKISEAAAQMQAIYASLGDFENAYTYLAILSENREALSKETRARIESEMTAKYEAQQRELENQKLKEDKQQQGALIQLQRQTLALQGGAVLLLTAFLTVLYVSRRRVRKSYAGLQEAHGLLEVQQAQIVKQTNELLAQSKILQDQNAQLEQHSLFKNKVLSIISHDLRGPYGSLRGILGLVQSNAITEAKLREILNLVGQEMEVVGNMLDNVLIWAKAQLEESRVALEPVRLRQFVDEHLQLVSPHAQRKNISLLNEVPEEAVALADRERLGFVLRNLLMNAIKFSYDGGEVGVEAQAAGQTTAISVRDSGKGISAEIIPKVFTHRRLSTAGTSGEKGTGIGLMLCNELAESFGGSMAVRSQDGKGSVFSVNMPTATQVLETAPA